MFIRDDDNQDERRRFSRRALVVGLAQVGAFGVVAARLNQLQVVEGKRFALLADDNRMNVQMLAPARGRIFARGGEPVAANVPSYRVVVVPALAGDLRRTLLDLSRIVPMSPETRARQLARIRRQPRALAHVVATDLTFEQVAAINLLAPQLPGVQAEIALLRHYGHGVAMAHVVGHVGAPARLGIDDDPVLRLPGMRVGKTGVERALDKELRGHGGLVRQEVDARGRIIRDLATTEPRGGLDVALTLDVAVQTRVMQRVARERRAAVAAIAVETGEVMALASAPGHDANEIVNAGAELARLQGAPDEPLLNRATHGLYPPGSTFKMVTALAGLEAGVLSLKERITCNGTFHLADQSYRCWSRGGHGECDLHRALKESCDVFFYETARRTGIEAIARMGRRLGLGQVYSAGIGPQKSGVLPNADWKRGHLGQPWFQGETLLAGIGQGYVLTTPLQLAVMTARIATGRALEPVMARPASDRSTRSFETMGLGSAHLDAVRRGMYSVVNESGGTGHNAQLDDDDARGKVAGKTGTSQINRASTDRSQADLKWEERDHALFVAYVPADRPRYAVAAVIEHGGGGGAAAAPLAKDVIEILLDLDPASRAPAVPGGDRREEASRRGSAG